MRPDSESSCAVPTQIYTTKDGSAIRELWHPDHHGQTSMSLAEATVPAGAGTLLHKHVRSEEIYYVVSGKGLMECGDKRFRIQAGDTVRIPPGTPHRVEAGLEAPLVLLCCCSPPYRHDDTEIL